MRSDATTWRRALQLIAWVVLVGLIVATLGPVELRPSLGLPLKVERFLGFAIVAALFTLAYPRRWISIMAVLSIGAVGLELLQFISPTRDPSPIDAIVKVVGAIAGAAGAHLFERLSVKRRVRSEQE